jgi:glycosyltransferase involved in cell wall biosynthesis
LRVNVITNPNSAGLRTDADIVCFLLHAMGIDTLIVDMFSYPLDERARGSDLNIFLESLHEGRYLTGYARANWLVPNAEWYYPHLWDRYLPLISLILCKTQHAYRLWSQRVGPSRCLYTGFESRDMLTPYWISRDAGFIHIAGKSESKGTDAIAEAWKRLPYHPLTVITSSSNDAEVQISRRLMNLFSGCAMNVRHLHSLSDEQLSAQLSGHRFAIQPSLYEGYGHSIHEALSAQCVVLTTDAPPMNEFAGIDLSALIPVVRRVPRMMVEFSHCSVDGIRNRVEAAAGMREEDLDRIGDRARQAWERERLFFRETFTDAITRWEEWI